MKGPKVEWLCSSGSGVRFGRTAEGSMIEWQGLGRLMVSNSCAHLFQPALGVEDEALRKFRATDLLACERYLAGHPSLHGSAVAWSTGALALVGESGAGKSTTAMGLVEQAGAEFAADDIVPVDVQGGRVVVEPVDDCLWLKADTRDWFGIPGPSDGKRPVVPSTHAKAPSPLLSIVQLVFDEGAEEPELTRVTGQEAFVLLSRCHVSFSFDDADAIVRDLEVRSRLATVIPIHRLRRGPSMETLPAVVHLLAHLANSGKEGLS